MAVCCFLLLCIKVSWRYLANLKQMLRICALPALDRVSLVSRTVYLLKKQGKRVTRARLICVNSIERGKCDISENNCATAVTNPPLPVQGSPVQLLTGLQVRNKGFPRSRLLLRHNLWPCFLLLFCVQLFITRKE